LSVVSGESTQAEAARRHGISETSIGTWKEQLLAGGRQGLEHGQSAARPTGAEARLAEEIDDLTRALGEAPVKDPRARARRARGDRVSLSSSRFASITA
jgi:transposase-like protein